jgi:septum formation protein
MLILASQSPRRQALLKAMDLDFQVMVKPVDETFPSDGPVEKVAEYLAEKKADAFDFTELSSENVRAGSTCPTKIITCDTVVIIDNEILGKPNEFEDAFAMLKKLSGREHTVITGVCIKTATTKKLFSEKTVVHFKHLSDDQIRYYIETYKPFDKAGAYGIQEWIGLVGIEKIEGCYYNVMGLPTSKLAKML